MYIQKGGVNSRVRNICILIATEDVVGRWSADSEIRYLRIALLVRALLFRFPTSRLQFAAEKP